MGILAKSEPHVRFGEFDLDPCTRELRTDGRRLILQEQPFQILAALLEHPGHLVTRDELRRRLWSSDTFVDFERSLNKAVNRLREVLEESADQPRFIETLPRQGYRFIAPAEPLSDASKHKPIAPAQGPKSLPAKASHWKFAAKIFAGIVTVVLVASLTWKIGWKDRSSIIHSIAVLPLENLSGDPSQDYFADGMTDELIN